MRFTFKTWPYPDDHPIFPKSFDWAPILNVRLSYPALHSPPTKPFEAWVDSGSPHCYFHSSVGQAIGIDIEKGIQSQLGGIIEGPKTAVFYHDVALHLGGEIVRIRAGFSEQLAAPGILGRIGFFDNFIVVFDTSSSPPFFEVTRMHRT